MATYRISLKSNVAFLAFNVSALGICFFFFHSLEIIVYICNLVSCINFTVCVSPFSGGYNFVCTVVSLAADI